VLLWTLTGFEDEEWALWRRYDAGTALLNIAASAAILALAYVLTARGTLVVRLARLTAIVVSAGFTLGVLELPAILWGHDYGQTFGTRYNDTWLQLAMGINQRDDDLIHVHKPHSRFRGTVSGNLVRLGIPSPVPYEVDLAYDRNGFRNDQEFTQADVVVIGDSFVEGAETPRPQTVVAEIGRRLGVTAVNLGQSAYGPQQELVVLKRYGAPLAPRSVVWFLFGGNDLSDVDTYEWRRAHPDEFLAPPALATRLFARNALTALARITTTTRTTASPTARRHETTYTRSDGKTETMYLDAHEGSWEPRQWEVVARTLTSAKELSTSIGADLFVVYIPRKLRVYQGYLRAAPGAFANRWTPNNLPEVVAEFCRGQSIAFLDATVPLRRAVAAGESVYLTDDVHWNPAGHRVVAAAVAERIHQMGTLIPPAQAGARR
jgi:lysophospholipase L1-like esterase